MNYVQATNKLAQAILDIILSFHMITDFIDERINDGIRNWSARGGSKGIRLCQGG